MANTPHAAPNVNPMELGLVHIYTGHGKGKTTASLGLAMRAIGQGYKVCMIQFLKGGKYTGEYITAHTNIEGLDLFQFGKDCVKQEKQMKLGGNEPKNIASSKENGISTNIRGHSFCGDCRACFAINEEERFSTQRGMAKAKAFASSGEYDVVILDEICGAINTNMLELREVIELIKGKHPSTELILTGRDAPMELIMLADYVSEIRPIKHPYDKGIEARRGIEF